MAMALLQAQMRVGCPAEVGSDYMEVTRNQPKNQTHGHEVDPKDVLGVKMCGCI